MKHYDQITCILYGLLFGMMISCSANPENDGVEDGPALTQSQETEEPSGLKEATPLSGEELAALLPETVNGQVRSNVYIYPGKQQMVAGTYGTTENTIHYTIADAAGSRSSQLVNFDQTYNEGDKTVNGNTFIMKERDGYRTIAFLQPKIRDNTISFLYAQRFRITLESHYTPDEMWGYVDREHLKKMDTY